MRMNLRRLLKCASPKIAAFRTLVIQDNKEADPRTEELRQQITGVEKEIESLMEKLPGAGEALTRHIDESITALERKKEKRFMRSRSVKGKRQMTRLHSRRRRAAINGTGLACARSSGRLGR